MAAVIKNHDLAELSVLGVKVEKVPAKTPEGKGYRFTVDLWVDNQEGEVKTVATAEVHVE